MAYTAWSVVYGEQPTAAKWNQLGQNDAGFKDGTNIDNDAIIARHILDGEVESEKLSSTVAAKASRTGASYSFAAQTFTKVVMQQEIYDFGSDYDLAQSRFTAPVAGIYNVSGRHSSAGTRGIVTLYKNGAEIMRGSDVDGVSNPRGRMLLGDVQLAAGDYIEMWGWNQSTSAGSAEAHEVWFACHLVGRV